MAATARIPLLVTPAQKSHLAKKAKLSNLTLNEFLRSAAEVYDPNDDDQAWVRLIQQVKDSTHTASDALEATLTTCADSNKRIAAMEAAHRAKARK
jgi:hypothetical protein